MDSNAIDFKNEGINFVGRTFENNGIQGKIEKRVFEPNESNTITATVIGNYKYVKYQKEPYYCSQNINKLTPKNIFTFWNEKIAYFCITHIQKFVSLYNGQQGGYTLPDIKNYSVKLPVKNNELDLEFMEKFIAQLEAEHVAQLEAYLLTTGLKDYNLTNEEHECINHFHTIEWKKFNLKELFGESSRGKRLKSADRTLGSLPFVTAGESEEGVSAFINNEVAKFSKNTITIDMFGSAKYRNYEYGADDHVSIVHTEDILKYATIFITAAIHKSSYTGKFSYSRNFYPKDADELNIMLPVINNIPDYNIMNLLISAVHKLVIKDVIEYTSMKIDKTKDIISEKE